MCRRWPHPPVSASGELALRVTAVAAAGAVERSSAPLPTCALAVTRFGSAVLIRNEDIPIVEVVIEVRAAVGAVDLQRTGNIVDTKHRNYSGSSRATGTQASEREIVFLRHVEVQVNLDFRRPAGLMVLDCRRLPAPLRNSMIRLPAELAYTFTETSLKLVRLSNRSSPLEEDPPPPMVLSTGPTFDPLPRTASTK